MDSTQKQSSFDQSHDSTNQSGSLSETITNSSPLGKEIPQDKGPTNYPSIGLEDKIPSSIPGLQGTFEGLSGFVSQNCKLNKLYKKIK
jgi:hypothetical protein